MKLHHVYVTYVRYLCHAVDFYIRRIRWQSVLNSSLLAIYKSPYRYNAVSWEKSLLSAAAFDVLEAIRFDSIDSEHPRTHTLWSSTQSTISSSKLNMSNIIVMMSVDDAFVSTLQQQQQQQHFGRRLACTRRRPLVPWQRRSTLRLRWITCVVPFLARTQHDGRTSSPKSDRRRPYCACVVIHVMPLACCIFRARNLWDVLSHSHSHVRGTRQLRVYCMSRLHASTRNASWIRYTPSDN
jgi:hypothetical protein